MEIAIGGAPFPDTCSNSWLHTDDTGDNMKNLRLSDQRAGMVRDYLIDRGLDAGRLKAVGYGEDRPIVPNDSRDNRTRNRRVEFVIIKD